MSARPFLLYCSRPGQKKSLYAIVHIQYASFCRYRVTGCTLPYTLNTV